MGNHSIDGLPQVTVSALLHMLRAPHASNSLMILPTNSRTTLWAASQLHRHTALSNSKLEGLATRNSKLTKTYWMSSLTFVPMTGVCSDTSTSAHHSFLDGFLFSICHLLVPYLAQ